MSRALIFKTSEDKAEKLGELVREKKFTNKSDALETALTLLLEKYGKLGVQPVEPAEVKEGA